MLQKPQGWHASDCKHCEYRTLRMFCNLSPEELKDFDKLGMQMKLPKGAILFQEDDPSQSVAVICDGQMKLSCMSREGKTLILKIAVSGDVLGLGAVISGSRYEATAEALEPTVIKTFRKDEFLAFLGRHGEASMHAAKALRKSTSRSSLMRGVLPSHHQLPAGWPQSCLIGGELPAVASPRCASQWLSLMRIWRASRELHERR